MYRRKADRLKPSLPEDEIEIRIKYHDSDLMKLFIRTLTENHFDLEFQGVENYNDPPEMGRYFRFLRVKTREASR